MIQLVRAFDNKNSPIVDQDNQYIRDVYFNLIRLDKGQSVSFSLPLLETVWVVLSGTIDMTVDDAVESKGRRARSDPSTDNQQRQPYVREVLFSQLSAAEEQGEGKKSMFHFNEVAIGQKAFFHNKFYFYRIKSFRALQ